MMRQLQGRSPNSVEARAAYLVGHARRAERSRGVTNPYHRMDMYDLDATE